MSRCGEQTKEEYEIIKTEADLRAQVDAIKSSIPETSLLLFRGQNEYYESITSKKERDGQKFVPELEKGWQVIVNRIEHEAKVEQRLSQAVLQHYGMSTSFLDLTSDEKVAAWFAINKFIRPKPTLWIGSCLRIQNEASYETIEDDFGYLYVFEIENYKELISEEILFDITKLDFFTRPKKQSGFLFLNANLKGLKLECFVKKVFKIDRTTFLSAVSQDILFPLPGEDHGYERLLNVPYVQLPVSYVGERTSDDDLIDGLYYGQRAIDIPMYVTEEKNLFAFDPKWKDTTIYEPSNFRTWKEGNFNPDDYSIDLINEFKESVKITISLEAKLNIFRNYYNSTFAWLDIGSDNIFFTMAALDHDKVIDHSPPYSGILLSRWRDEIYETIILDEDDGNEPLVVEKINRYSFENGVLSQIDSKNRLIETSNDLLTRVNNCLLTDEEKNINEERVKMLLSIHSLMEKDVIALLQHPYWIEDWYFLI